MIINKVSVFCASSTKVKEEYLLSAKKVGNILSKSGIEVFYGGGAVGSMGALAEGVIEEGGKITGIIPKFMIELEWANPKVKNMIVTETINERKEKMLNLSDGIIALPGGTGTLDELVEAISHKKLGLFDKPIVILNTLGFYDYLISFLEHMADTFFIRNEHLQLINIVKEPEEIIEFLKNYKPIGKENAINLAAI